MRQDGGEAAPEMCDQGSALSARASPPSYVRPGRATSHQPTCYHSNPCGRHLARLADTLEELRRQTHRIDPSGRNLNLGRIGTMCEGADEQPVSPWRKGVKHKSSDAVRGRRRVRCVGSVARSGGENRIVRERTTGIRESTDHGTETHPQRRTLRQPRRRPFCAHVRRAASRHRHRIIWVGAAASAQGERCQNKSGWSRNPAQVSATAV